MICNIDLPYGVDYEQDPETGGIIIKINIPPDYDSGSGFTPVKVQELYGVFDIQIRARSKDAILEDWTRVHGYNCLSGYSEERCNRIIGIQLTTAPMILPVNTCHIDVRLSKCLSPQEPVYGGTGGSGGGGGVGDGGGDIGGGGGTGGTGGGETIDPGSGDDIGNNGVGGGDIDKVVIDNGSVGGGDDVFNPPYPPYDPPIPPRLPPYFSPENPNEVPLDPIPPLDPNDPILRRCPNGLLPDPISGKCIGGRRRNNGSDTPPDFPIDPPFMEDPQPGINPPQLLPPPFGARTQCCKSENTEIPNIQSTIYGYAIYLNESKSINIPNIGLVNIGCVGGHACNNVKFMPKLLIDDLSEISASNPISCDNLPGESGYDPPFAPVTSIISTLSDGEIVDSFTFTIPDPSLISNDSQFRLESLEESNPHYDVVYIILVGQRVDNNNYEIIFSGRMSEDTSLINRIGDIDSTNCVNTEDVTGEPPFGPNGPYDNYPGLDDPISMLNCIDDIVVNPIIKPSDKNIDTEINRISIPHIFKFIINQDDCSNITSHISTFRNGTFSESKCFSNFIFNPNIIVNNLPRTLVGGASPYGSTIDVDALCPVNIHRPIFNKTKYTRIEAYYQPKYFATPFIDGIGYSVDDVHRDSPILLYSCSTSNDLRNWICQHLRFFTLQNNSTEIRYAWPFVDLYWNPYDTMDTIFEPEVGVVYVNIVPSS